MEETKTYDAVVIGSGFGGAVTACRLAEKGYSVLVLERGHRWGPKKGLRDERNQAGDQRDPEVMPFPRRARDAWLWDHRHPERASGWIDFRAFPYMGVAQGAGVGGGSLIYSNVLLDADARSFARGWPKGFDASTLAPYYKEVGRMLEGRTAPSGQRGNLVKLLEEAAGKTGAGSRHQASDLAVRFDDAFRFDASRRPDGSGSIRKLNMHGAWQGTCTGLGTCNLGCELGARNTLDKNYLHVAEAHGAEIRPRHLVRVIAPEPGHRYRVHFDQLSNGRFEAGSVVGRLVVVAAGSLGSTELLLRCKEQYGTLPKLSPCLGKNWSSNGDVLTPAFYFFRKPLYPARGVPFAGHVDFLDGGPGAASGAPGFNIEDGGFPYQAARTLVRHLAMNRGPDLRMRHKLFHLAVSVLGAFYAAAHWLAGLGPLKRLRGAVEWLDPVNRMMPWVAQGQDAANGTLRLKDGELFLEWDPSASVPVIDTIIATHTRLAHATGGWVLPPIAWKWFRSLITPHPLGGCNMGDDATSGVVNHKGEVFGYPRLYVADGAIVPEALGVNPAKTIAALAERNVELMMLDHPRAAL
ncbi:MAG TPA: GMC oxidoreductase [Methylomirabilota bacterium]|nr:GMC oxidoreductase [Methylomirabilota bacterium]